MQGIGHGIGAVLRVCALLCASGSAWAQQALPPDVPAFDASAWSAADDAVLERLRGGFEWSSVASGLAVSFGFVRSVSINGELVQQTRFSLPDLAHVTPEQAMQVSDALAQTATAVQNSLSNQNIQTLTQIDAGVNSLGILQSLNSQGVLRDALIGAVGVR